MLGVHMTHLGRAFGGIAVVLALATPGWAQSRADSGTESVQWLSANLSGAACVVYEAGPTPFSLARVTENTEVQFDGSGWCCNRRRLKVSILKSERSGFRWRLSPPAQ